MVSLRLRARSRTGIPLGQRMVQAFLFRVGKAIRIEIFSSVEQALEALAYPGRQ
jgi:hypothetical protein